MRHCSGHEAAGERCAKDANNRTKSRVREGSFLWDDHRIRILGFTMIGRTYTICITFFMRLVVEALTHLFCMLSFLLDGRGK